MTQQTVPGLFPFPFVWKHLCPRHRTIGPEPDRRTWRILVRLAGECETRSVDVCEPYKYKNTHRTVPRTTKPLVSIESSYGNSSVQVMNEIDTEAVFPRKGIAGKAISAAKEW